MFHVNPVEPGARIHHVDPFAEPEHLRSAARRLRGRLASPVTLWTASGPAGLTVSSTVVADGDPARLLGLVSEDSDVWLALSATGRFAVSALRVVDRQLADRFAGLLPAPGGPFAAGDWTETPYGPVPSGVGAWAGCRLDAAREFGWAQLVEATIETIELADADPPLIHYRGRYHQLDG
jgi:flavin reductase (DIM6/NTAB) family NADH-FMN oxidoreductase RutF